MWRRILAMSARKFIYSHCGRFLRTAKRQRRNIQWIDHGRSKNFFVVGPHEKHLLSSEAVKKTIERFFARWVDVAMAKLVTDKNTIDKEETRMSPKKESNSSKKKKKITSTPTKYCTPALSTKVIPISPEGKRYFRISRTESKEVEGSYCVTYR